MPLKVSQIESSGRPAWPCALGDLARQHRAGRAVAVGDRDRLLRIGLVARARRRSRLADELDQLVVEHLVEAVVLALGIPDRDAVLDLRLVEQPAEVEPARLPVADRAVLVEVVGLADQLVERAEAHLRHQLAHLLGDEEEEVDDVLGLALELRAQHGVLRGDADGARVEMALAHHDAAGRDQRRGGEAELVGAEQRADHDVAAGAHAAVDLHRDAAAQPVGDQRLVRLGKADLPRASRRA